MSLCLDKRIESELRSIPGNNVCCDCEGKSPQWASVSFGIFMCLECSGKHRALGVHISFVRSVSMDSWTEKQISIMRLGGNEKFNIFLGEHGIKKLTDIPIKYNSSAASYYREKLRAEVNGSPIPSMPNLSTNASTSAGSEPLQNETEEQYVTRQKLLQEQARERMRSKFGSSTGLSSSGRMQGIGSDPNYNPGSEDSKSEWDVNQLAEVSQKAFSVFATSVSIWGEAVSKKTQQLLEEPKVATNNSSPNTSHDNSNEDNSNYNEQISTAWSSLATGAVNIWKKATDVTTDIISVINQPEEEDFRFPRPLEIAQESSPSVENNSKNTPSSTMSSWDSLSDIASGEDRKTSVGNVARSSPTDDNKNGNSAKKITKAQAKESTGEDFFASFGI